MAKVSTATIRLVQKLNRRNKNGEFPIYVVVCFNGRLEKASGVSCLPKFWDARHGDMMKKWDSHQLSQLWSPIKYI